MLESLEEDTDADNVKKNWRCKEAITIATQHQNWKNSNEIAGNKKERKQVGIFAI